MSKYDPLSDFLVGQGKDEVRVSFEKIESILGRKLPYSARHHRPWWANDATGHVHARAWLSAGFETARVDMAAETLVFVRVAKNASMERGMAEHKVDFEAQKEAVQHPLFGAMKGLLWTAPDLDLTKPALDPDEWEQILEEKYGANKRGA